MLFLYLIITFSFTHLTNSEDVPPTTDSRLAEGEKKMSETILEILEHFKQPDPVGIPGAKLPDPYPVPNMNQSIAFGTQLYFKNSAVYGISKFRIVHINVQLREMEVQATLTIDKLQARGDYTLTTWINRAEGPYTVDILGLKVHAKANLGVEREGKLRAQDMHIDIGFSTIAVNFKNLGIMGSVLQGVINTIGPFIFDSIKPFILKEAYTKVRDEINTKLNEVAGDMQFPNSITPLDMIIIDARKLIRAYEYDPYKFNDHNDSVGIFSASLTNTCIVGATSIHRVGNITLRMENNTVIADFEIGTQKLEGTTQWEIAVVSGLLFCSGTASFTVEYIRGRIILAQPLDTRKRPECKDLDLEIGNIQVRFNGTGTLDYVIEAAVNIFPNLLRYQIMKAAGSPLKILMQEFLNKTDVEEIITQQLHKVDEMQTEKYKLSTILKTNVSDQRYDEDDGDDFFNF